MSESLPESVVDLLQAMVRVDSVNGALTGKVRAEAELVALLQGYAERWAIDSTLLAVAGQPDSAKQLLLTVRGDSDRPWILFDSHLDTVAVDHMTIEPFGGLLSEDRVWGRGACDTKGTGAAMLWALRDYASQASHVDRPNNVAMLFSVDEEVGMTGVQSFIANDLDRLGDRPSLVVVGEPTEHIPVIAHNGCVRWALEMKGKAAHSAIPWEGRSAIRDMVTALGVLDQSYIDALDAEHELTGRAVASVNVIAGGNAPNIIPESCVCEIDRRLVPGEDPQAVLPAVAKLLDAVAANDPGFDYAQTLKVAHPPLVPESSAAILPIVKQVLNHHGVRKPAVGAPFCTHAGYLASAGLPTLVLGPGSPHPAHTKDEWVSVDEIELGVRVYTALMQADFSQRGTP